MTSWSAVALGDVADLLVGYAYKSSDFTSDPHDVRLLRGVNIGQGFLDWGRTAFWPSEGMAGSRYRLAEGDVVLAMDRPWIEAGLKRARLRADDLPALLVQRVARLRGTRAVRTSFLHHLLATETFSRYLQGIVTGATVPHISQSQIGGFRFRLPPIPVQDSICDLLDSIDDLIENNRRRVKVLEETARVIYREWFVCYRYPGHEDVPLVDSPLGPIPDNWTAGVLDDLAQLERPSIQPAKSPNELFDHYSIPAFDDRQRPAIEPGSAIKSGKYLLSSTAVLVSKLNPRIERVWFAEPGEERRSVTSTEFLLLRPRDCSSLEHLYLTTRAQEFRDQLTSLSGGTSGSHQRAKPADFLNLPAAVPPARLISRLGATVSDHLRMARVLRRKSDQLADMRDLLLPKLVTGQIDVSHLNLDALTEAATA